tara:strand:- start:937 stop:1293 length:357 start_codon:yes stop_codon:yes gene_type:complete
MFKYFKSREFASPDVPSSGELMDYNFMVRLEKAREIAGVPFVINSGFRSEAHNRKVNGSSRSSHLRGYACDISCKDSLTRWIIVNALLEAGFKRIGIAQTFIHVDADPKKIDQVIWTY